MIEISKDALWSSTSEDGTTVSYVGPRDMGPEEFHRRTDEQLRKYRPQFWFKLSLATNGISCRLRLFNVDIL